MDDEKEIVSSVRELLDLSFGEDEIRIVEAHNGLEGTVKIQNQQFDCIITDMRMPKKEGDALITSVRQSLFNVDTPIIMLTGYPNKKILNNMRFVYLLEKPFRHDQLVDMVATQLKMGNTGDRLAADMVNNIVNATEVFLTTVLNTDQFKVHSPVAKKPGDPLSMEFLCQVNLFDNGIHNSFSLLLKEEELKNLSTSMPNLRDVPMDKVAHSLGVSILNHALKGMRRRSGINYKVQTMVGQAAQENLDPKKGIIIPLECEGIQIKLLACGEKKLK